jgi:hypothetical protein
MERIDPGSITEMVGLTPSRTYRAGDEHVTPNGHRRLRKRTMWQVDVGPRRTVDLESMIEEMLVALEPVADAIRDCVRSVNLEHGELSVVAYMADQTPAAVVTLDHMSRLVALGLNLDIDLYLVDGTFLDQRLPT